MIQTVRGWMSNAGDRLDLMWTEPLSWLILAAVAGAIIARRKRFTTWKEPVATAGIGIWIVATLAMTVYPLELEAPAAHRFDVQSIIPLAGTVQSFANAGNRTMSDAEYAAARQRVAVDFGIPVEDVRLDRVVRGPGFSVMRDPVGNVALFMPLGLLMAFWGGERRTWRTVLITAAGVSTAIELSQLLFGLGSLGSIDDVIANSAGAMVGFGLYQLTRSMMSARAAAATV